MIRLPYWLFVPMVYISCEAIALAMIWSGRRIKRRIEGKK